MITGNLKKDSLIIYDKYKVIYKFLFKHESQIQIANILTKEVITTDELYLRCNFSLYKPSKLERLLYG